MVTLYLVIELKRADMPRIIGLFRKKKDAETAAYDPRVTACWRNVIPLRVF